MLNYYKIASILHSGKNGERGTPRTDGKHPFRINKIIEINDDIYNGSIQVGFPMLAKYIKDENGNDLWQLYLQTSPVVDWDFIYDGLIRVETFNTIYKFERVDEG